MYEQRVVISGFGVASALGIGRGPFWQALLSGQSGARPIERFATADLPAHSAAWVPEIDMRPYVAPNLARRLDWPTRLALVASSEALSDAGLVVGEGHGDAIGLILNTAFGPVTTNERYLRTLIERGPREASPLLFPGTVTNAAAGYVAMLHRLRGVSSATVGASAVSYAADLIRLGQAECVLAGGFEELAETPYRIACELGFLAVADTAVDERSRPYDRRRNGFVIGEGAAVLVVESFEHALRRGARIYAEIAGYASAYDPSFDQQLAFRSLDAGRLARTIQAALDAAERRPAQIDAVLGLALSSQAIDRAEAQALDQVFGPRLSALPVSALKAALGETLGASDTLGIACAALALSEQILPPTLHYEQPDPTCPLHVVTQPQPCPGLEHVLSTSLEFSGMNTAVVLQRYRPDQQDDPSHAP